MTQEISQRLSAYFSVGINAIIDKNFDSETARSHSSFVVLRKIITDLTEKGELTVESAKVSFENIWKTCESLSSEMNEILKHSSR